MRDRFLTWGTKLMVPQKKGRGAGGVGFGFEAKVICFECDEFERKNRGVH